MTGPEQVSVNVADLRSVLYGNASHAEYDAGRSRLVAAIRESDLHYPTQEEVNEP